WCPTASAPQDGCAARRAPSSASLFSRSTASHESSTAVPSPCSHQSRVSCANNPPPRSAQSLRRPPPIRSSRLPSRSPLGSAGSTAFRATVDHGFIATLLQRVQQPLYLTGAHPQLFGSLALRDQFLLRLLQGHQPVLIGLCHQ